MSVSCGPRPYTFGLSRRVTETLIVWTEPSGVDYALSFQDPDGCEEVWNFIQEVQRHISTQGMLSADH